MEQKKNHQIEGQNERVVNMLEMPRGRDFNLMLRSFFSGIDLTKLLQPDKKVLEVGCGKANTIRYFAKNYRIQPFGVDLVDYTSKGKKEYKDLDFTFKQGDALNLPFENDSFDVVFSHYTFQYLEDKLQGLKEIHRVLKLNGRGIIDFGRLEIDNQEFGNEYLYDSEISPNLEDILINPLYKNNGQLKSERVNIFDENHKGKFQDRRSNRVIIHKNNSFNLKFPPLIKSEEKFKGIWPFVHCTYAN